MTYGWAANDWADAAADSADRNPSAPLGVSEAGLTVLPSDAPAQVRRSPLVPVAFALPVVVSGLGYLGGGLAPLTDLSFLILTGLCVTLLAVELVQFNTRQGIGAVLIYGGVLVWFCHDYLSNWFLHDYTRAGGDQAIVGIGVSTIARAWFYHCLFINVMVIAYRLPVLRFVDRLVVAVPEPANPRFYLGVVVALLLFGWSAFFATADPLPVSLAEACLWWVPGMGPLVFTVSRTGNMNYSWGAYVAQILQVGEIGGILGAFYALLVARTSAGKIFGWLDWLFWASYTFTSYRRGDVAFMAMPVMGVLFLKYHAGRDPARRVRDLWRATLAVAAVGVVWIAVSHQTAVRARRADIQLFRAQGNTMFSEGLSAWVIIPDQIPFPYDTWPGEGFVRPLPETLWWFVVDPVPRALWTTKPIEQFGLWYSAMISHDTRGLTSGGVQGTTVSTGAVGFWYFRYGPGGVVEGAVLYGWLMGVAERALRRAQGQPLKVMFALGFATFLFRSYRDLYWHNLYPLMIGAVVLWFVIRLFFNGGGGHASPRPPGLPLGMPG